MEPTNNIGFKINTIQLDTIILHFIFLPRKKIKINKNTPYPIRKMKKENTKCMLLDIFSIKILTLQVTSFNLTLNILIVFNSVPRH